MISGQAKRFPKAGAPPRPIAMTNVRTLGLPQWRCLAEKPENRCLIPLTEFCEWSRDKDPEHGIKGEMWFGVTDHPIFAVAGFWQAIADTPGFAMVTCDPNELVAPIHRKAMITILEEADWDRWLTGSYDDAVALQLPYILRCGSNDRAWPFLPYESDQADREVDGRMIRRLRCRLWWSWAKMRLGSNVLRAAGFAPPE